MPVDYSGVTVATFKRLLLDAGAVYKNWGLPDQAVISATRGGNEFTVEREIRQIEVDNVHGRVKGTSRIIAENARIVANFIEMTTDVILKALPGTSVTSVNKPVVVPAEYVGSGDGTTKTFTLDHAPVIAGTERIYVDGVVKAPETDYTINNATGEITFITAPALDAPITAAYTYESGVGTQDEITSSGVILDTDYIANIAIVGRDSGTGQPTVCLIENALATGGLSVKTVDKNEAVLPVTFEAHYDSANVTRVPWKIILPVRS